MHTVSNVVEPLGKTQQKGIPSAGERSVPGWKRVFDCLCIVVALPLWLPLGLLISLLIKIVSDGPVLFRQERIGYRGRPFVCLKFRTMVVGADHSSHRHHFGKLIGSKAPMVKMDTLGDRRLIPFGLVLRATGLDELPQIINVLRGEMSLVGPRPCTNYEYEHYLPWQKERFNALPGLTGLWQVSGKNRTTFDEMIALDIRYVHRQSLWLDVRIVARTIPALIAQVRDTRRAKRGQAASTPSLPSKHAAQARDLFAGTASKRLVPVPREE